MRACCWATLCALPFAAIPCAATEVFRCEDDRGRITYAQQGCPTTSSLQRQQVSNPTPGSGKPTPMAATRPSKKNPKAKASPALTVVGAQQDDCGNLLSSSEKRVAIIKNQVRQGMSREEVESSLGRPDRVSSRNGETQYNYQGNRGHSRSVSFDEAGCVKGKAKAKSRP
jgi:hypothetical protein